MHAPPVAEVQARTVTVAPRPVPLLYSVTGTVVSDERVEIGSRVAAYVRSLDVREGQRVAPNDLVATLDSKDVDAALRVAEADRARARAALHDATRDLEVSQNLFARAAVAEVQVRKARLLWEAASEALAAAEAAVDRAGAERQYVRIVSPVAGVVVARHRREGDLASPGMPLVTVESDTALLFETYVSEQRIQTISAGDAVKLQIDALGRVLEGRVLRVVPSGNPATRGFRVKISVPEGAGLLPGMFGRAQFTVGEQSAIVVPTPAMVDLGGLRGVFVVDEQDLAHFRWLRTEHAVPGGVMAPAGLEAGERIVLDPPAGLREGDRIVPPAAPPAAAAKA
ncbi:efflux RND transporter periplasmic adaptor subunit [Algiphilus sp. W345]|uniref:Efflux RND transporter periplasmic adaptor subunit n=1 Tax=Banduia mediterranea TaxID=3075609 RepID=A0ABU2WEW2_9GAMM|nr:efflux RND transporter periplasmic adaptor subunit [Algiphilus sp. W345]MDT0496402.1 efflux RND transporter periplasmic adaptor subunit [Algiphilus sp. W345]